MRSLLVLLGIVAVAAGCGGGDDSALGELPRAPAELRVSSPAFSEGSRLERRYTCDGAGEEPQVVADGLPPETEELVVVVSDPDGGDYVHLTRYGIPPRPGGAVDRGGEEGRHGGDGTGWTPPCPPEGSGAHRYVWSVYALGAPSGIDAGAEPGEVTGALEDDVLAGGTRSARYER